MFTQTIEIIVYVLKPAAGTQLSTNLLSFNCK